MRGKVKKQGHYELFETTKHHQILNLNDQEWYAIVEGQRGDIIVRSDADHEKEKPLQQGHFYLAHFQDDPEFNDVPQLLLQHGNKYTQFILPNDLPSKSDYQKKLVRSSEEIPEKVVREHVEGKGDTGSEKQYQGKAEHLRTKTVEELQQMAKERNLPGRSRMNKEELVKQLENR